MGKRPAGDEALPNLADDIDNDGTVTNIRAASRPPVSGRPRPFLIVLTGSNVGEMYTLNQPEIIIGRAKAATVTIDDDGVSRRHARLTWDRAALQIEDLGSANGTFVNGEPLASRRELDDGDKITLGSTTILKFTYSDDVEEAFQRRLRDAALRDGLTGAFNKQYLMDRLATELAFAQRHKTALSLIIFDADHFKAINDAFGHPAGDEVLVQLTRVVQETIRKEDVLARYGGEEFVVLCRSVDVEQAAVLAERLRERIAGMEIDFEGARITVTVSIGIAGIPAPSLETAKQLVAAADEALYVAKSSGRNRVSISRQS
jgi:two-component system, cell cycle response regulator